MGERINAEDFLDDDDSSPVAVMDYRTSDEKAVEWFRKNYPPCPDCGAEFDIPAEVEHHGIIYTPNDMLAIQTKDEALGRWLIAQAARTLCAECSKMAEVERIERQRANRQRARQSEIESMIRSLVSRGLIQGFMRADKFDDSLPEVETRNSVVWSWLRSWTQTDGPCVWIWGPEGTGKTFAARCVLNRMLDDGIDVAEIAANQIESISRSGYEREERLAPYKKATVLLIDDIDKVKYSEQGLGALWDVLNHRYDARLRTLITSNVDGNAFKEIVSKQGRSGVAMNATLVDSLIPRLHLPGKICKQIKIDGDSLRRNPPSIAQRKINLE